MFKLHILEVRILWHDRNTEVFIPKFQAFGREGNGFIEVGGLQCTHSAKVADERCVS